MSAELRLQVNGEERRVPAPLTVAGLLARLEIDARQVAVERNRELVPKTRFEAIALEDGDRIEIVTFVGGG